jgi:hypothetical protein
MLANLQPHTITVNRPTPTKGTSGAEKDTYSAVYSSLPCFVQPVSASWQILYSQRKIEVTHSVYFNQALTIKTGDQLAFGTRTFLVKGVRNLLERGLVTVVDAQELT